MTKEEEFWFEEEKRALTGDRNAVLNIVSALRRYRFAARDLLEKRYTDGECDGYTLHMFAAEVEEIGAIIGEEG